MELVSTHSRLKAAGQQQRRATAIHNRFNTQPPEGGWEYSAVFEMYSFTVSTHSRLKAAGKYSARWRDVRRVSTHSRLKAAGKYSGLRYHGLQSFNTQPPEGGWAAMVHVLIRLDCFNTQPPEGGWSSCCSCNVSYRRFNTQPPEGGWGG